MVKSDSKIHFYSVIVLPLAMKFLGICLSFSCVGALRIVGIHSPCTFSNVVSCLYSDDFFRLSAYHEFFFGFMLSNLEAVFRNATNM